MSKIDIYKTWKYDESLESTSYITLKDTYDLFIGGDFVKPLSKKYFNTLNPATNQSIAKIADANDKDIDKAVKSAIKAFKSWSKLDPKERGKYIFRIARMIQERAKEFAVIESMDGGKPIRESRDIDIPLAANHFFYHAGWADKLEYAFPNKKPTPLGVACKLSRNIFIIKSNKISKSHYIIIEFLPNIHFIPTHIGNHVVNKFQPNCFWM